MTLARREGMVKILTAMKPSRLLTGRAGYSVTEMLVTVSIMGVVGGMAALQMQQSQPVMKADGGMRVVMGLLNTARELSITQRKRMQVQFVGGSTVQIVRVEVPGPTTTVLYSVPLEGGVQYGLTTGVPDTPEAFGNPSAVYFGGATVVQFNTDGMLIDGTGAPINGTVFLQLGSAAPRTARAVTVMGSTGRVRGYKWDGARWVVV